MSDEIVLISGVTGFIGSEVTRQFIDAGHHVRGTVRSMDKAYDWEAVNPEYKGKLDWTVVKDVAAPGAFDEAIKGVTYVIHTASPFHYNVTDNERDLLVPAIQGTRNMLDAAKSQSSVKHLIVTSSFAAIFDVDKYYRVGHTYSPKDWNPATYEEAKNRDPVFSYCASKALAERLLWEDKEHDFPITTILPPAVWGPVHQPIKRMTDLNTSIAGFYPLVSGHMSDPIPRSAFPWVVDVRDVAALHVRALTSPLARNARLLALAHAAFNVDVVDALKKVYASSPGALARVPTQPGLDEKVAHFDFDSSLAEKVLGRKFISLERCVKDTAESLWSLERQLSVRIN